MSKQFFMYAYGDEDNGIYAYETLQEGVLDLTQKSRDTLTFYGPEASYCTSIIPTSKSILGEASVHISNHTQNYRLYNAPKDGYEAIQRMAKAGRYGNADYWLERIWEICELCKHAEAPTDTTEK